MSPPAAYRLGQTRRRFGYFDAEGVRLYEIVRSPEKRFAVRRPDGRGGWIHGLGDVAPVLYRLPELLHRPSGSVVCVVEGEAKADRLVGLGLSATCSPFGAGAWRERYALPLSGADVVILPDFDEPGERHAQQVAASVHDVAASVAIVRLPGLHEPGDDVLDWLDRDGHTVAELLAVIDAAPLWTPLVAPPIPPAAPRRTALRWPDPPRLDDGVLERARRVPIARVLEAVGRAYTLRGRERRTLCPLHDDHHPSLRFDSQRPVWFCSPCQRGGDVIDLTRLLRGVTFVEAVQWLASL